MSNTKQRRENRYDDKSDCSSTNFQLNNEIGASSEKKINSQTSNRSITKRSLPPYEANSRSGGNSVVASSNSCRRSQITKNDANNSNEELKQMSREDEFFC